MAQQMPFTKMEQIIADWSPHVLTFAEVKKASNDIEGSIIHTPLCEAKLSKYMDYNLYLKCENLQYTGSCAERGVRNAFHNDESLKGGVIVPSYCNTALGAAYHGSSLGIPVTAVLPNRTPPATAQRCSELGADVILCGDNLDDAITYANKLAKDNTQQAVLTSDHPLMMAGLGSVGVEILMQLPEAEAVLVPVRSGALLAAVLVACKKLKCSTLVYGVESAKTPKMMKALQFGKPVSIPVRPSLADGLNISTAGHNAFATIKGRLDRMLVVEEAWLARALVSVAERERLVADAAGVSAVAAVMQGLVPELRGKKAVCIITGGNIDAGRLSRLIHRGLAACSRLLRFTVPVADQRDGLDELAKLISDQNAVIKSMVTEQMWMHSDVGYTWANVVVETANDIHAVNLKDRLREFFPQVKFTVAD